MRRWISIVALSGFLGASVLASAGCYGSFSLSRKLHAWNGQASSSKFVNWLLFLGLIIVPVYEISLVVDGFIFNTIEFWTGDNPVASGRVALTQQPDGTVVAETEDGQRFILRPGPGGSIEVIGGDGALVGHALRGDDGSLTLRDAGGAVLRHIPADQVDARRAAMAR